VDYARELKDILARLVQRSVVLFIGADFPERITGLPSRQALADALAIKEELAQNQRLATVTQRVMRAGNRFAFTDFLRRALDTADKAPQPFHRHVVTLVRQHQIETIITTAYDDLLESAFRQAEIGLDRVVTDTDLRFLRLQYPRLLKLYGDLSQVDTLIVTEQDENALLRGRDKPEMVDEIRRAFRQKSILFLGHNPNDSTLNTLLDEVAGGRFQMPAYAAWLGLSQPEIESYKGNRHLTILGIDPVVLLQILLK
jgi:hypothetical protein